MSKRTQRHKLRHLSKDQYSIIRDIALKVTALNNDGLYQDAVQRRATGYHITKFEGIWEQTHNLDTFKNLNVDLANATIRELAGNIAGTITKWKEGDTTARVPQQKDPRQPSTIHVPKKYINKKKGTITIPGKRGTSRKNRQFRIPVNIPQADWNDIATAKIVPKQNGAWYELHITLEDHKGAPSTKTIDEATRVVTIDPGLDNMMTCTAFETATDEEAVLGVRIYDGRELKSRNQGFNKRISKMHEKIAALEEARPRRWRRRVNRVYDAIRRAYGKRDRLLDWVCRTYAANFVSWCLVRGVEFVAFSWNDGFKRELSLGCKSNQAFSCIPLARLRDAVEVACERAGIGFGVFEESYTSKASAVACDYMPVYGELSVEERKQVRFSGSRVHRGLYVVVVDGVRFELNADVNANINQLEKCKPGSRQALMERLGGAGLVTAVSRPERVRLLSEGKVTACRKHAAKHAESKQGKVTTVSSDNPK